MENGHPIKTSSLGMAVSPDNSFQAVPADNLKSYIQNNAITAEGTPDASQPDTSQDIAEVHLPTSSEADITSTAFTSSAPEQIPDPAQLNEKVPETYPAALDTIERVIQAPTSDLREEPQPATLQQSADIKEQKHHQDLLHDPDLANGLTSGAAGEIETDSIDLEPVPEISAESQANNASISDTPQIETSAEDKEPIIVDIADVPHHPPVPVSEGAEIEAPIDPAPSPTQINTNLPTSTDTSSSLRDMQQASLSAEVSEAPPPNPITPQPVSQDASIQKAAPNGSSDNADQAMLDAPTSPSKIARPRDEDDADEQPAVKRTRVDGEGVKEQEFKKPDRPEIVTDVNGTQSPATNPEYDRPITSPQHRHLLRILGNIKRTKDAAPFLLPVDHVALNIPTYPEIITNPMDLGTIEDKAKKDGYHTVNAFVSDFDLIVRNTEQFNGLAHAVTQSAHRMKASYLKQMEKLPGPDTPESVRADKKKKATVPSSDKPVAPRRESRSSLPGTAQSPIAPATPTFALGPQGVPVIRRDSTLNAERPKREIHPPAPRDLPYANQKPKKKKYQMELRFCQHVLDELTKPRYKNINHPFLEKVDPVALNIPNYFNIIKNPMDLGLMQQKLDHGEYENAKEFDLDGRLVFANCFKFNPPNSYVNEAGKSLEDVYNRVWKDKQSWIEKQTPASGPTSAGTSPEGTDDEEEEEDDEDERQNEILKLQQQIAAMSKQVELITQKKKTPPVASKKTKNAAKPEKKGNKKAAPAASSKSKSSKPAAKAPSKAPYVTYEQKQDISNRINSLPEAKMGQALGIIRENMPKLKVHSAMYRNLSLIVNRI